MESNSWESLAKEAVNLGKDLAKLKARAEELKRKTKQRMEQEHENQPDQNNNV